MAEPDERAFHTRGQPAAAAALSAMLGRHVPHALALVGPPGVGKTTLALDLAAALLCLAPDPAARPCRSCRACRAVEHGNHPDVHLLKPAGPGAMIPIGGRDERGVRDLVSELALLPVEGGARVAVIESADRMSEDAQSALLKTLEEPPAGTVIVLCAAEEERLLPTIRSRCVRLRLGPVPRHDVEAIIVDRAGVDATVAARVARLAAGRPGIALAYAASPEAVLARGEIARSLLDLRAASRTDRLRGMRDLAARAAELVHELDGGRPRATDPRGRGHVADEPDDQADGRPAPRVPAAERRSAALALVAVWRDVLRDLATVGLGEPSLVRDVGLLDEVDTAARSMTPAAVAAGLARLDVAGERLEGNVSPELVLDVLALHHGR